MTRDELLSIIAEVRRTQSELETIEVKAAYKGTPERLFEPLSAFANSPRGGIIVFGLDERKNFDIVGVEDASAPLLPPPRNPHLKRSEGRVSAVLKSPEWAKLCMMAFGIEGKQPLAEQVKAWLRLYVLTARMIDGVIKPEDREVIDHTVSLIAAELGRR